MSQFPTYRILLIGDTGTGKTSMIRAFSENSINQSENSPTTMPILHNIQLSSQKGNFCIEVIDTAGTEDYTTFSEDYFTKADAIIFVCSSDNSESLENITVKWKSSIDQIRGYSSYKSSSS